MVAADVELLKLTSIEVAARREAEAKAAAEFAAAAAAASAAVVPAELAGVLDAIKRSPLMLDLPADHPGLGAVAGLVSLTGVDRWGDACVSTCLPAAV